LYVSTSLSNGVSTRNRHGSPQRAASIFGDSGGAAAEPAAASAVTAGGGGGGGALPLPAGFAASSLFPHAHAINRTTQIRMRRL
jgi:hypothetical protein